MSQNKKNPKKSPETIEREKQNVKKWERKSAARLKEVEDFLTTEGEDSKDCPKCGWTGKRNQTNPVQDRDTGNVGLKCPSCRYVIEVCAEFFEYRLDSEQKREGDLENM